ncbi:microtubule-associated protein 9 isoform X3 [Sceloporus undulatus]|uniref:microtubule-associated protein 9 isoform X3 n=1 Tax=Sceloporus undulatus TaxID=8520 RepID=UPI001C4CC438|nr:microtubule-associated protein 9 isoform X3 [Sceloporus undulatus]
MHKVRQNSCLHWVPSSAAYKINFLRSRNMSDEESVSTLAYSKSPKFSKRTSFQAELQEALSARAAKQQMADYSEDFESDDEGSEEEFPEILENNPKKSVGFTIPLCKKNHGNRSSLKSESEDDLSSSDVDQRPHYVSKLEKEVLREEREAVPFSLTEHSGSYEEHVGKKSIPFEGPLRDCRFSEKETANAFVLGEDEETSQETTGLKNKRLSKEAQDDESVSEEGSRFEEEGEQLDEVPVFELQLESDDVIQQKTEIKPVPKPREFKSKAASVSAENISIPALHDYSKPSPQPRSVLRKSSHVEDYEGSKAEDKASHNYRFFSLSAPSSETKLNDQVMKSERRALAESPGPEGPWIASSSSPFPIHFSSVDERTGDSNLRLSGEEQFPKDEEQKETGNSSDLKLLESDRKSPSVIELMMTTVYEKTKKLQKSTEDDLEEKLEALERSAIEDGSKKTTEDDKFEQKLELNTSQSALGVSKDSVKEESEESEIVAQNVKSSISRSLSTTYLKKTGKPSHIPISTSSQYLGTLKFLDNKHLQKYSAELDKADSLRAAVYQDWVEKKRIFLLELQRIKRNKAENLREKSEKAFEKWKEKKAEYLKQQLEREKRVERLKKKKEEKIIAEKKKDSRSAVEKWNEKKEEFMKQKKKEKIQERKKEVEQEVEMKEKDQKAIEAYEKWLEQPLPQGLVSTAQNQQSIAAAAAQEKKEMDEMIQRKQKKLQVILEDETPPPWSPPGKVMPSRSY